MVDNTSSIMVLGNTSVDEGNTTLIPTSLQVNMYQLKAVYYSLGILGMLGNTFVIYVIARSPNMRTKVTNMNILNQSSADFLGAFFMIMTSLFEEQKTELGGTVADIYCYFWMTKWTLWSMLIVSTYNLILITIERYIAVVYAVWHKTSFTKTKAIASMITVWLVIIIYVQLYMMIPTKVDGTADGNLCNLFSDYVSTQTHRGVSILNFAILYFIPLIIIVFCYGRMAKILHNRIQPTTGQQQQKGGGQMGKAKHNVIKTMAAVSCGFVLCWTCNQVRNKYNI